MSLLQNSNAISTGGAYNLESSLRFRSVANAYLSRTPTTAGNRKTWTISFWFKRGIISSGNKTIYRANGGSDATGTYILLTSGDVLNVSTYILGSGYAWQLLSNQVFRDPSAWYHLVVSVDTTQATASDRVKLYVNGEQITSFSTSNYPSLNYDTHTNNTITHYIGTRPDLSNEYFDGYITEFNLVDGQALTPSDFGETDTTTGVWKPKEYAGTYGTNGFYLPMKETQQATGFNTVLYTGNGTSQSITGVGFSPDLVWLKYRSAIGNNELYDTIRGAGNLLVSNQTSAETTNLTKLSSIDSDGFSVGSALSTNTNGGTYVAWCWDAGSSTVSNTDGTITSSVRANPATGFSVVTGTTLASGTLSYGHGLGVSPAVVIYKSRTTSGQNWWVWHKDLPNASTGRGILLNSTNGEANGAYFGTPAVSSTVVTVAAAALNNDNFVSYCFAEVAGYSKFGSYTGNGSTSGPTVTTGFRPAFVMIKRTDSSASWYIQDNTRDPNNNNNDVVLCPNLTNADIYWSTASLNGIKFTDTGFQLLNSYADVNASGGTYIYMAFADTRDAQFNFDASGNKNNWTANNINSNASSETTYDIMNDVPTLTDEDTANFCTLNPLSGGLAPYNANLSINKATTGWAATPSTFTLNTGKWYFESGSSTVSPSNFHGLGLRPVGMVASVEYCGSISGSYGCIVNNTLINLYSGGVLTASSSGTYTSSSVFQCAVDFDAGKIWFGDGTSWVGGGNPSTGTTPSYTFTANTPLVPYISTYVSAPSVNFGQRPFAYTPPTGFKKLNTYNLPDSTIVDGSQYMNTVTWTGTGTTNSVTGFGFQPDLNWTKVRDGVSNTFVHDIIRGTSVRLATSLTNAEAGGLITSFDSDGFTTANTGTGFNGNGYSYVTWGWRGSDSSPVSNTDGTITSTVSANTTSGFSVVTYTGNGISGATVGHGLGAKPAMVILKDRDTAGGWEVWHQNLGSESYFIRLNESSATYTGFTNRWTAFSASNITLGNNGTTNSNGDNYVAYCFADVEGFSKFGSYTGNGSADGPFVYTGFRPAYMVVKRIDSTGDWFVVDSSRATYNQIGPALNANTTSAEFTLNSPTGGAVDFLSNGFKWRGYASVLNGSGGNYIYMAFAENPFKQSLAR